MLELHLLVFHLPTVSFPVLYPCLLESVIVSTIVLESLVEKVDYLVASHIQELPGVRHNDDCALAVADIVF